MKFYKIIFKQRPRIYHRVERIDYCKKEQAFYWKPYTSIKVEV